MREYWFIKKELCCKEIVPFFSYLKCAVEYRLNISSGTAITVQLTFNLLSMTGAFYISVNAAYFVSVHLISY